MLLFGHAGLTLAGAWLINRAISRSAGSYPAGQVKEPLTAVTLPADGRFDPPPDKDGTWLSSLARRIDLRLLLIGSLLPDIIDKPVGLFIFGDTFSNGRIFCHTILFLAIFVLAGVPVYWIWRKNLLFVLGFGIFSHLILDGMWRNPKTLLWPWLGFSFPQGGEVHSFNQFIDIMLKAAYEHPEVVAFELLGAVVIFWLAWGLVRRRKLLAFLIKGQV